MSSERLIWSGSADERELLQSARADRPDPGAKSQLVALLAGGAVVAAATAAEGATLASAAGVNATGATAATAASGAAAAGAGGAGTATVGTAGIGGLWIAKWAGVGLLAGTTTTVVVATTSAPSVDEPVRAVPAVVVERPVDSLRPQPEEPTNAVVPAPPAAEDEPAIVASATRLRVGDEIAALDAARAALGRGDAAAAGGVLETYRRSFPKGVLQPEAAVLEVQVAMGSGNRERAASLARSFLVRHPSSPHAPRVRALLSRATARGGSPVVTATTTPPAAPRPPEPARPPSASGEASMATPTRTPSVASFGD